LVKDSEEERELRKDVKKKILEIIVGLLKDRVEVEKVPMKKKAKVDEILSQKQ